MQQNASPYRLVRVCCNGNGFTIMCNFQNTAGAPFGYVVDTPEIRALVERAEQLLATV